MADLMTAVKSVRNKKDGDAADALLTARGSRRLQAPLDAVDSLSLESSARTTATPSEHAKLTQSNDQDGHPAKTSTPPETPSDLLHVLRSQPDLDTLKDVLKQLRAGSLAPNLDLHVPGPLQAQIVNALVSEIVPIFWPTLPQDDCRSLLLCLRNLAGLNAIVSRLRLLASQNVPAEIVADLLDVTDKLISYDELSHSVWIGMHRGIPDQRRRDMAWKELVSLLGSGKIIAAVAQAEDVVRAGSKSHKLQSSRLAKGAEYSAWLGRNIAFMTINCLRDGAEAQIEGASSLLAKGLHLGHTDQLLRALLRNVPIDGDDATSRNPLGDLTQALPASSKRTYMEHLLRWISFSVLPDKLSQDDSMQSHAVSGISGLLWATSRNDAQVLRHIQLHLSDPVLSGLLSLAVRRASLAVLAKQDEDLIQQLLEKLISTFSSTLFIAHAPITQQESIAQSILIAAGYVHRNQPMSLLMTARSSGHMQGVSNRLDTSNARARWLGMVVGLALSRLVDKPGSQMEFGTDELKSEEAMRYADLVHVVDVVGTFRDFKSLQQAQEQLPNISKVSSAIAKPKEKQTIINGKPVFGPPRPPHPPVQTKIVGDRVTEILDDDDENADDLKPYAKPDSDPEDSDDDATLVNRNKARAPVYIRDLMAGLRDEKSFDRFSISVKSAASLIRRKVGFGKEVTDHAEELAGMLCNLQDPFDMYDFDDLRLQALVAVLLSNVKVIAPLLSSQAFAEGYSIAQRCVILSALGLGGREMAGFKIEDEDYNPKFSNSDFPSKRLPPRLHAIYSSSPTTKRLESATRSLEHSLIQPLALYAADQSTSHLDAVKVRTFSSRMDVENARTKRKPPANALAKCFSASFFFPLANRYQQEIAAYGNSSVYASAPFVLVTFVKTLALLLHASGPATLELPGVSAEMWDLLLSLRMHAIGDISVLQAVLFALLTLLEVNTDHQRIVSEHPKQLMETQQWVDLVIDRMGGGGLVDGGGEEAKVRTLAAGVLMKCKEIIEAYQKQLVGNGVF